MTLPNATSSERYDDTFSAGGGELGGRIADFDWSQTPLGPMSQWPQSLKTIARVVVTSRYAMWMGWGPELTFLYNDAYARMTLGKKHPWALGKPAHEVWAEIWPEIGPRIQKVLETGESTWDEALMLFLERSGYQEETYHTFSYSPLTGDDDKISGLLCVVTEETERVIGERQLSTLRTLAADLGSAMTEADVLEALRRSLLLNTRDLPCTLTYFFENDGTQMRLACASGIEPGHDAAPQIIAVGAGQSAWPIEELLRRRTPVVLENLGEKFKDLPHGAWDRPPTRALLVPIAKQGQDTFAGVLIAGLNPYRQLDPGYSGFVDLVAGQVAAAIANARAYEEERRRAAALAEIDRAKTAFFSNVSHEFRTPLTLMLGPTEDALARPEKSLSGVDLETVHRNELRLLKLVNTLLDFSRLEAGRIEASYRPTDLQSYTLELAGVFRSAVEKAGLQYVLETRPLRENVYVDRDMWEKIVLNLLSNALKSTFEGKIVVRLRDGSDSVVLEIEDTGTGIADSEIPHLFERFRRIENARRRTHEGSGIGLALVHELVNMHGGSITVKSQLGQGTTFTVSLPYGRKHLPQQQIVESELPSIQGIAREVFVQEALGWSAEPQTSVSADDSYAGLSDLDSPAALRHTVEESSRGRVLVVDDNHDMREYLRRLLSLRFEVATANNGRDALAKTASFAPDLVLSDIMMPEMDGMELLAALRTDPATQVVPVILLSARAGEEASIEGLQHGADDYLVKPFSARELLARVQTHLDLARLRKAAEEALSQSEEDLRILQRVGNALASELDLKKLVQWVTDAGRELSAAEFGTFFYNVINDAGERHILQTQSGTPKAAFSKFPAADLFAATFAGKTTVRLDDVLKDSSHRKREPDFVTPFRSYLAVPVISRSGELIGGLFYGHSQAGVFTERTERLVEGLAKQAAIAMDNARLFDVASRERHRAEASAERFRAIVETTPECVTVVAPDGELLLMNPSGLWMVGAADEDQVTGKNVYGLIAPEDRERFRAFNEWVCGGHKGSLEFDLIGLHGTRRRMEAHSAPLRQQDGTTVHLAVARDITERKRAEEALRRSEKLAAVGRLAATVAHEINNPLESITNLLYLAKRDPSITGEALQHLLMADQELERVAHVARQTLGFYRDSAAPYELNVAKTIDELLGVYSYRLRAREITLIKDMDSSAKLLASVGEFRQVFSNLVLNAIDAVSSHKGIIRIKVRAGRDSTNSGRRGVRITVADNGCGISPEHMPKIFDSFYTTKEEVGTGLGLWLARNIVHKYGGSISVRSSVQAGRSGTVFSVFWPETLEASRAGLEQKAS